MACVGQDGEGAVGGGGNCLDISLSLVELLQKKHRETMFVQKHKAVPVCGKIMTSSLTFCRYTNIQPVGGHFQTQTFTSIHGHMYSQTLHYSHRHIHVPSQQPCTAFFPSLLLETFTQSFSFTILQIYSTLLLELYTLTCTLPVVLMFSVHMCIYAAFIHA